VRWCIPAPGKEHAIGAVHDVASLNRLYSGRAGYQFQEVISTFEHLAGLTVSILFRTHYEKKQTHRDRAFLERVGHLNDFCTLVKSSQEVKGCKGYDGIQRARKAGLLARPFIDECPAGVVELVVPLLVRGRFVATVFCGPIRRSSDRAKGFEYVWNKVAYRGIDRDKLRKAYQGFPHIPRARLLELGNLLFYALSYIGGTVDDDAIERQIRLQKNPLVREAVALVQSSESEFPSAGAIAKKFGITPEYFSRLFKKVMKKNFVDFLIELRMLKAQDLLTNTTLPIVDIAYEVGYQRHSYFAQKFHEITGITPSKWRATSSLLGKGG
jgi:AraC-like DNA-binding protein